MVGCCSGFVYRMSRRKHFDDNELKQTNLARVLSLFDLIALGVGTTLGAGAYVLAGQVAKRDSGPAVIISFLIAAIASVLSALCYAEFGARVPRSGSAYVYVYVTVAEIAAFIIGWNMILEYVIGAASVARTASGYIDDIIGNKLIPWFEGHTAIHNGAMASYADLIAGLIILVLTAILTIGVKESTTVNKIFTVINLTILIYVIMIGAFKDDPHNWDLSQADMPALSENDCGHNDNSTGCGSGGFAPYGNYMYIFGFGGIVKGAATCFFAFVGFDSIATTGEEAKHPQRNIPLATIVSLFVVFVVYSGISMTITMMTPYYNLDMNAPFAVVFKEAGWEISRYVVSVGAICALTTSLLGGMFPMPRVILTMAADGLLFRFLARIEKRVKTPVIATVISGVFAAVMATVFDTDALVEMMSIGTLMAYTLVSASVLLLRYEEPKRDFPSDSSRPKTSTLGKVSLISIISNIGAVWNPEDTAPSIFSTMAVKYLTIFLVTLLVSIAICLNFGASYIFSEPEWWALLIVAIPTALSVLSVILISRQPESTAKLSFKAPLVQLLPALSVFINAYLMINLTWFTWVRFAIWMMIGFIIYFGYGIWHSKARIVPKEVSGECVAVDDLGSNRVLDTSSIIQMTK